MTNKRGLTGVSMLFVLAALAACGGGGGGGGDTNTNTNIGTDTDTTAPTVASTVPASGATGIAAGATVTVTFSETMDCASLSSASLTLVGPAAVTGSVSCNGSTATFTPATALAMGTQYTATVTTAAKDAAGNALAANHVWSFTTTPKVWGAAALIETDDAGAAYSPQIAIDASGNALTVWYQYDGTRYNIWASRYTAGAGWGTAALIETDNTGDAREPQIATDANGNAMAVWVQEGGPRRSIVAVRYTAATNTWGTAALIETDDAGNANEPRIAIDASGNALAVWAQDDGTETSIFANRYTASNNTWGTAVVIETDNVIGHSVQEPQIAIDADGNALAVWAQSDGARTSIWANRYTAGTGWDTAALIETDDVGDAYLPQIAIDIHGNALAVWSQSDGTHYNIVANRYTASNNAWGTAAPIETNDALNAGTPQIAMDATGNALAVWVQDYGTRYDVWANRYAAGAGWGTAALIETDNAGSAGSPQVAFDANGNALAVWQQSDGTRDNIWANRYSASTGWGTAEIIEGDNAGTAVEPQIAVDTNGNALAVWYQSDSAYGTQYNIWANRYQ